MLWVSVQVIRYEDWLMTHRIIDTFGVQPNSTVTSWDEDHVQFHDRLHPGWEVRVDRHDLELKWTVPGGTVKWSLTFSEKETFEDFALIVTHHTNQVWAKMNIYQLVMTPNLRPGQHCTLGVGQ
ncbi:hypothetical protein BJ138DRAFT_1106138, partial [Hygrophoropsis aurantiaca]